MATSSTSRSANQRPRYWRVMTLFAVAITFLSLRYLSGDPEAYFDEQRATYIENQFVLIMHIVGASFALVLGAVQMLPSIRVRRPVIHRILGRVYGVGVLVGSVFGLLLSRTAFGGAISTAGFAGLAIFWLGTLVPAIVNARNGDIAAHRRWMIRNYALTYAAVTLRIWLPIASVIPGLEFIDGYRAISWLAWVPNLIAAELFLRRSPRSQTQVRPVATVNV